MAVKWYSLAETLFLGSLPLSKWRKMRQTLGWNAISRFLAVEFWLLWLFSFLRTGAVFLERISWLTVSIFDDLTDLLAWLHRSSDPRWLERTKEPKSEPPNGNNGRGNRKFVENVFDERDWSTGFSPFTEDGLWEENRLTGDERRVGERRRESGLGWANLRADFYQRAFNRIKTDNRSIKKSTLSSNPDLGLTLSAPTALTNSVEPLCLATA